MIAVSKQTTQTSDSVNLLIYHKLRFCAAARSDITRCFILKGHHFRHPAG